MLLTLMVTWLLLSPALAVLIGKMLHRQSQHLLEVQLHLEQLTQTPPEAQPLH